MFKIARTVRARALSGRIENKCMEEKKKKFISEKIIGRDIDRRQAGRWLLLALGCGLVFGVAAALAFFAVERVGALYEARLRQQQQLEAGAEGSNTGRGTSSNGGGTLSAGKGIAAGQASGGLDTAGKGQTDGTDGSVIGEGSAFGGTSAGEAGGLPEDGTGEAAAGSGESAGKEELAALVDAAVEKRGYTPDDYRRLMETAGETIEKIDSHVVAVTAVATNTTWFDDTVERTQTFSGLILSTADPEILILTTEAAVQSAAKLAVTFPDGTQKEAVVKQQSHTDQLAVLAVAKEGLDAEFLTAVEPVVLGNGLNVQAGSFVIAAGAPLGQVHSYDTGLVGYVGENEAAVDGVQRAYYADIAADAGYGTFLMDLSGNLVGMAIAGQAGEEDEADSVRFVSIMQLRRILAKLEAGSAPAYLGMTGKDISSDLQDSGIPRGMYVTEVATDSPAYAAGVKRGDIVTGLGEETIEDVADYEAVFRRITPGDSVRATVRRKSANNEYKDMEFTLTVGSR